MSTIDKAVKPTQAQPSAYDKWRLTPTPDNLTAVIKEVDPVIEKALYTHGFQNDPSMKTTARLHVAKSLPRFDPARAQLPTFVFNELRRLQRIGHKRDHLIPVPEGVLLDINNIRRTEGLLTEDLGRPPSAAELADATGLSTKRITRLKTTPLPGTSTWRDPNADAAATEHVDEESLWMDAVYAGLDPIDQNILDWATGRNGQPTISKTEMAQRLKMSVPAVSQRAQRIAAKLDLGQDHTLWPKHPQD